MEGDPELLAGVARKLREAGCVFAEDEAALLMAAAQTEAQLLVLLDQRRGGRPLEYVLGWVEFCGIKVGVEPGVFVPRARTEPLALAALEHVRDRAREAGRVVAVDLCCGAGAIALTISTGERRAVVHAADVDPVAVACARRNLAAHDAHVHHGDMFEALPPWLRGGIDVLVANVPYVPTSELALMPRDTREYEPVAALDGGADGLRFVRHIATQAATWLRSGGAVLVETSMDQSRIAAATFDRSGLPATVQEDVDGLGTCIVTAHAPR